MKIFQKLTFALLSALMACCLFVGCNFRKVEVTYMVDGAQYIVQQYDYEEKVALPTAPAKEGYSFVGWYKDEALTQPYTEGDAVSSFTLYAKYNAATVYIIVMDGTTLVQSVPVQVGGEYTLQEMTKDGYEFKGYVYYDASGAQQVFPMTGTFPGKSSMYVFPNFTVQTYTVSFVGATDSEKTVEYGEKVTPPTMEKAGYDLVGWYTSETTQDDTTKFDFETEITEDVTLYAKYAPKTFTIWVNGAQANYVNPVSVVYGENYTLATPDRGENYTFAGFVDKDGNPFAATGAYTWTENIVVTAKWTGDGRDIYFYDGVTELGNLRISSTVGTALSTFTLPAVPEKEGYSTDGKWYADSACTTEFAANGTLENNINLYAKYTANTYKVTFKVYGTPIKEATLTSVEKTVTFGQAVEAPAVATSDTYKFVGYYYVENGIEVTFDPAKAYAVASNIEVFEKWEVIDPNFVFVNNGNWFQEREDIADDWTYVYFVGNTYTMGADIELVEGDSVTVNNSVLTAVKAGTATIKMDGTTYNIKVVEMVRTFNVGADYSNAWTNRKAEDWRGNNAAAYLTVGRNNYIPDLEIKNKDLETLSLSEANLEISVVDQDGKEIIDYKVENGAISFAPSVKDGTTLTVTVKPRYSISIAHTASFTITLNNGVNVYTHAELKAAYANAEIKTINVLRNITAVLAEDEVYTVAAGATWTNGSYSGSVNEGFVAPINKINVNAGDNREIGGNGAYERLNGNLTLNGNYFTVDGSKLPLVDGRANPDEGGFVGESNAYIAQNVQFGIFMFGANDRSLASGKLTINDLMMTGNFTGSTYASDYTVGTRTALKYSGACIGVHVRNADLEMNNTTVKNCAFAANAYGDVGEDVDVAPATLTVNNSIFDKSWSNNIYVWGPCKVTLADSFIGSACGASIHFDSRPNKGDAECELNLDDKTVIENWVTGNEAWFTLYNANIVVTQAKSELKNGVEMASGLAVQNKLIKNAKTVVKKIDGQEAINFAVLMKTVGDPSEWGVEKPEGTVVTNFGYLDMLKVQTAFGIYQTTGDPSQLMPLLPNLNTKFVYMGKDGSAMGMGYLKAYIGMFDKE